MTALPRDPIAAVTHPDPYPFYAELAASRPLYRDQALGMWVAASAAAVTAVLSSELCRVRPPAEPVPRALAGSPAGEVFRQLVRMIDGEAHTRARRAVSASLAALQVPARAPANPISGPRAAEESERQARSLWDELEPGLHPERLSDFAFRLPVQVTASLLGVPPERLRETARRAGDFARCLATAAAPEQVERGKAAAGHLLALFRSLLATGRPEQPGQAGQPACPGGRGLLAVLAREAEHAGAGAQHFCSAGASAGTASGETASSGAGAGGASAAAEMAAANGVGLLFQAHDATAGLIGNTLLALAAHPDLRPRKDAAPGLLAAVVQEVVRFDPPVQNTRRFVARAGLVAGQEMQQGDAILVLLAAANRDPAANPDPDRFDVARQHRRSFTFGAATHACPGEALAAAIAEAGVREAIRRGVDLDVLAKDVSYHPSANVRIPGLGTRRIP